MRAFVLLCMLAAVNAAAVGYDYDRNQGAGAGTGSEDYGNSGGSAVASEPIAEAPIEFNKEFFTYTAPESEFNDGGANDELANSIKQSLRVIFIKGPETSGLENAALQLAKAATDDRTAIYVLNKQADLSDLAGKLSALNNGISNKPDVHFVKYRTEADAENAQRTIQSQYDTLSGPSTSHSGGVAPVLNFASPSQPAHSGNPPSATSGSAYLPPNRNY